jgi:DNA-binding NarL/FixJ family response regulator
VVVDGQGPDGSSAESPARAISVLLAHGEVLVRGGLRALLERERDIRVTGEAANGEEAVALARRGRPDLVLMDIRLPGLDCLDATRRIVAVPELAGTRVLMLSRSESDDEPFRALRAGASGFLVGDTEPVELVRAVRVVAGGEPLLSPRVTRRLIDEVLAQPDPGRPVPAQFEELTAREREVMTLVALGLTNAEIAERLVVSPATAKTHVSRAMMKLHARDRAKLVALAYQGGFVEPRQRLSALGAGARASAAPLRSAPAPPQRGVIPFRRSIGGGALPAAARTPNGVTARRTHAGAMRSEPASGR